MKSVTIHMVGNAHIDPVWLWTAAEGRQEVIDTCRSALERMTETPEFVFCRSSAATYLWLEQHAPDVFDQVRQRLHEGRWVPVGGWWEQPDCNVPSGEALVRQGLVGKGYFQDRFGVEVEAGYNVDTFGHAHSLPQILLGMGLKYYLFCRPGPHEMQLPGGVFWWESPDGSRVLAVRPPGHYGTGPDEIEDRINEAAAGVEPGLSDGIAFLGVGNHGGGPTKANIASILSLRQRPGAPDLRFSHPEAFCEAALATKTDFPVVREELQYHSRGCYTAVSAIKRANRAAENRLLDAETWSSVAGVLTGSGVDRCELASGWRTVLFNQFHDVLAGTSIRAACDRAVEQDGLVIGECNDMVEEATRAVAARVSAPAPGQALVVLNPLSWAREDLVEAEVNWREGAEGIAVEDPDGTGLPCQVLRSVWSGGGRSVKLLVNPTVPACGYVALRVKPVGPAPVGAAPATAREMDNGLVRVGFGKDDAWIASLRDLEAGVEVGEGALGALVVIDDPSDTWSHGVARFRDEVGRFEVRGEPEVLEWGPLRWTVRVAGEWGHSKAWQEFSLTRGRRQLDVRLQVDWHEQHRMLKLSIPTRVQNVEATYEIAHGVAVRPPTGDEEPAQRWVDVSGVISTDAGERVPYGVSLLNDCKYGFDICEGELRMSILRSPIYAFHEPAQVIPGERYEYTDQGTQVVRYAILPHRGTWRDAETVHRAAELNRPCVALHEPAHDGPLPPRYTFVTTDCANVDVEAVKPAERGDAIILRLRETMGRATDAQVLLPVLQSVAVSFRAWEIKTLAVSRRGESWETRATDLLERELPAE